MTLTQRREIVKRFMDGESFNNIIGKCRYVGRNGRSVLLENPTWGELEQVLRDYLLGKFSLKTRRKK